MVGWFWCAYRTRKAMVAGRLRGNYYVGGLSRIVWMAQQFMSTSLSAFKPWHRHPQTNPSTMVSWLWHNKNLACHKCFGKHKEVSGRTIATLEKLLSGKECVQVFAGGYMVRERTHQIWGSHSKMDSTFTVFIKSVCCWSYHSFKRKIFTSRVIMISIEIVWGSEQ